MPGWNEVLSELVELSQTRRDAVDVVRRKYLKKLHEKTERNVIAYYSGWLSKPRVDGIEINDADISGLMNCIQGLDTKKGLDIILHTPGGGVAAVEAIVKYLEKAWQDLSSKFHIEMDNGLYKDDFTIQMTGFTPVSYFGTRHQGSPNHLEDEIQKLMFDDLGEANTDDAVWYMLGITKSAPYTVFIDAEISQDTEVFCYDPEEAFAKKKIMEKPTGEIHKSIEAAFQEVIKKLG